MVPSSARNKNLNQKFIIILRIMQTIKKRVLESIKKLPDDVNYDDIMESIYVQQMISEGIEQLDKGEFISHEDFKERFKKWLK
jgi:vacuolar-type H+-ATPase subunit E/Vma4